jgi:hypothetical protein
MWSYSKIRILGTMKTFILIGKRSLTVKNETVVLKWCRRLLEKLKELFTGTFESDWEVKTGLDWDEFGKFPHIQ